MATSRSAAAGPTALGEHLRARRELVTPGDVGLSLVGLRRVPGLRREEVAMLAGISADYYLRLEQGRDRHPSPQVLSAIARVLGLDAAATDHLVALAAQPATATRPRARREKVPPGVAALLEVIGVPAFVEGRFFDVLAANDLARALSPNMAVGRNRVRSVFLDPAERALYPQWETATALLVAGLRESIGARGADPRAVALVGEMSLASERFARLWARHDVAVRAGASTRILHPQVGEMLLDREKLAVGDGLVLAAFHAQPSSVSADKLALLASLSAPPTAPPSERNL